MDRRADLLRFIDGHQVGIEGWTADPAVPEAAVAYDEDFIASIYARHAYESSPPFATAGGRVTRIP
jgi:hypothetical protein